MSDKDKIILLIYGFFSCFHCYSFKTNDVLLIRNPSITDYYFGYSLLLQKGPIPRVIVGAPKDQIRNGVHYGGQVYECRLQGDCTPLFTKNSFTSLYNPHGDFLGGTVDGEDRTDGALVVCSPRSSVLQNRSSREGVKNYAYTPGSCFFKKENIETTQPFTTANASRFERYFNWIKMVDTDEIYYEYGYALFGFDISFYNKDNVFFGAPGMKNANGYSVDTEIFRQYSVSVFIIAGEPRGNSLKGKAVLYGYDRSKDNYMNTIKVFEGDVFGSYFGATVLAVDVSNDNFVDILIGAPMSAGSTYEEGCVYFYRGSAKTFLPEIKLTGSSHVGSRFGTSMVSLGDFDLDGYNDVAISAPFENNGEGAVYIYRGSSDGLSNECSQKLLPSEFGINFKVKGFGFGISKGNDIDGNGHNDIAIGAYKTDQVFIVTSKSIIDYQFSVKSSIEALYTSTRNFDLMLCLNYIERSKVSVLQEVEFVIILLLDYRSKIYLVNVPLLAILNRTSCKTYNVEIKNNGQDLSPFFVDIKVELPTKYNHVLIAHGNNSLSLLIPYQLGCLSATCITGLTININSSRKTIILGQDKQFDLEILIQNDDEPANLCELIIEVPIGVQLHYLQNCTRSNQKYTCRVANKLEKTSGKKEITLVFDVDSWVLKIGYFKIQVRVTSIGVNKNGYKNKDVSTISVSTRSTTFIKGSRGKNYLASLPEAIELKGNENKDVNVTFEFTVHKTGPSPVEIHVDLFLPEVTHQNEHIFQILNVQGNIGTSLINCHKTVQKDVKWDEMWPKIDDGKILLKRTVMLHCKNFACSQYSCYGGYLKTVSQTASFEVRILVKSNHLVSKFKTEMENKNIIAYIPIVLQGNFTNTNDKTSEALPLLIFVDNIKFITSWPYLLAAIIGIVLFTLIVFVLYKCSFFDRTYKEKLKHEKMLRDERNRQIAEQNDYFDCDETSEENYME